MKKFQVGFFKALTPNVHWRCRQVSLLLLFLIAFITVKIAVLAQSHSNILILQSYHRGMLWADSVSQGLDSELPFDPEKMVHFEYMDTKRNPSVSYSDYLVELYRKKYADLKISVIIAADDNAFRFALKNRQELFSNAPLVFCGVNHFDPESFKGIGNFTGVVEKNDYLKTIQLAFSLHPSAKKLFVINDSTTTGKANREAIREAFTFINKSVDVRFSGNLSIEELKTRVKELSADNIILLLSYTQDANGRVFAYREIANHIKEVASNPVYCVWDFYLNGCATGGCITRGFEQGSMAAKMAKRILNGENASDIPVVSEYLTKYMFDNNKLVEFGISESRLPPESIVLNRSRSFYRDNKVLFWQISMILLMFVLLSLGLAYSLIRLLWSRQEVEEGRQRLKITLDSIAEAVIATDRDGEVIRMNPVAEKITGWSLAEASRRRLSDIFRIKNQDTHEVCENLEELVLSAKEPAELDQFNCLIDKGGVELPVAIYVSPIKDEQGATSGIVAVFRDTTEEMVIQAKLRHSQKMDAVGQLAGGVAHDFNNALSGIIGAVQLLQAEIKTDYGIKILQLIQKSADRAADLTAKLLAFSRKSRVEFAPQDFHLIIQASIDILSRTIDRRITLKKKSDAEDSFVNGNFSELESVLLNLGINASHAMPDGGDLSFETQNVDLGESYCQASVFSISPGRYLLLEVKDSGAGIASENLSKIFEPFFTTKEPGKGTGLGLSASYGTIVQHKGAINVYSELGRGTIFRIYLPVISSSALKAEEPYDVVEGSGTILLIDDEPAIRFTNRLLLESAGYKVLVAENGLEGLEIYKKDKDEIDLVILDMIMPEMNGSECFKRIKEFDSSAKVILCSGFPQDADVAEMKKAGLISFLYKPCRCDELSRVVAEAINLP